MSDKLYLENYLLVLKSTVEVYIHGTLESVNKDSRKVLKKCLDDTLNSQALTYDEMVNNNWYIVNNVKEEKICKVLSKVKNM